MAASVYRESSYRHVPLFDALVFGHQRTNADAPDWSAPGTGASNPGRW
jgi:hypothetical protein